MRKNMAAAVVLMLCSACGAPGETDDMGGEQNVQALEEQRIRMYLQQEQGFSFDQVAFRGDTVIVDQDGRYNRTELLAAIEEQDFQAGPATQPEGYYFVGNNRTVPSGPGSASNGHYRFTSSVPAHWRTAFRAAFAQWSSASSNDCVNFVEGNGSGSLITIGVGDLGNADDGNPAQAAADYPLFRRGLPSVVGPSITISTSFLTGVSAGWMLHTALHEIGHTLGFSHPWNGQGTLIPGTARSSTGCCSASYFTVMDYFGDEVLSADDRTALSLVFAKRGPIRGPLTCNY